MSIFKLKLVGLCFIFSIPYIASGNIDPLKLYWPTEDQSFFYGEASEKFLQCTGTGNPQSGSFGCVRNEGRKFHEGIDIKSKKRNRQNQPTDRILSVLPGKVVYVNYASENSEYGKYVVIEHPIIEPRIYTLYAHLSKIDDHVRPGACLKSGDFIGIMGNTSNTGAIPKNRAHLHFEMGMMANSNFQEWYNDQKFSTKNRHSAWNGMNLIGFDPLDFYTELQNGKTKNVGSYLKSLPSAFKVRIYTRSIPDFIQRYPSLVETNFNPKNIKGWDINFTWYGLPIKWTPIYTAWSPKTKEGDISILEYNATLIKQNPAKKYIILSANKQPRFGNDFKKLSNLLFDY